MSYPETFAKRPSPAQVRRPRQGRRGRVLFLNGPADGLRRSRQWAWGRDGFIQTNRNGHVWQVPSTGPRSIMKNQDRLKTMPGSEGPSVISIIPQTGYPRILISGSRPCPGGKTHVPSRSPGDSFGPAALSFRSGPPGLVISRGCGRGKSAPSLFPAASRRGQGIPQPQPPEITAPSR